MFGLVGIIPGSVTIFKNEANFLISSINHFLSSFFPKPNQAFWFLQVKSR